MKKQCIERLGWLAAGLLLLTACILPGTISNTPTPPAGTASAVPSLTQTLTPIPTATEQPLPTATLAAAPIRLVEIHMVDSRLGWAIGSAQDKVADVLRSQDGGVSWQVVSPPLQAQRALKAVAHFRDADHAWVTYTGEPGAPTGALATIWRTSDGGLTWQKGEIDAGGLVMEYFIAAQIGFSDAQNGWLLAHLGAGMMHDYVAIYTTADGGASWTDRVDPNLGNLPMSCYKDGGWFRDGLHGYVAGTCSGVQAGLFFYQSADGGTSWEGVPLPAPAGSPDLFTKEGVNNGADNLVFFSPNLGMLLVSSADLNDANSPQRWLYRTADGGKTWSSALLPAPWGTPAALDVNRVWYLARSGPDPDLNSQLYQSTDGGVSWNLLGAVNGQGQIQFIDPQTGWILARVGTTFALTHTVDGGASWESLQPVLMP